MPSKTTSKSPGASPGTSSGKPSVARSATGLGLEANLTVLPGIGPALAKRFAERGLHTLEDLLWFVPRRYDDARARVPLRHVVEQARAAQADGVRMTCGGQVLSVRLNRRGRKSWLDVRLGDSEVPDVGQQAAQILVRWFNARADMAERYAKGTHLVLSGKVQKRGMHAEMINPDVLVVTTRAGVTTQAKNPIIVRYSEVAGVTPAQMRKAVAAILDRFGGAIVGGLPESLQTELDMVSLRDAMAYVHRPPADSSEGAVQALNARTSRWHRRLAFEDLFILGLAVGMRRRARRSDRAHPCPRDAEHLRAVQAVLPFTLTAAQRRCIDAIAGDLALPSPMSRLLQGDVGSGKTAVAFAAAYQVLRAGRQVAFMAPTEILAEQHFATLSRWCEAIGVRCALLTASVRAAGQRSIRRALDTGYVDLVVGTHSLISDKISFEALGLVIIDEQHRFGVAQRVELRTKGAAGTDANTDTGTEGGANANAAGTDANTDAGANANAAGASTETADAGIDQDTRAPHLLVMTATPIPRTLALTAYGDLDLACIDEMPPGRVPTTTRVLSGPEGRAQAHALVRERLAAGERVFVVCPSIEPGAAEADDSDDTDHNSAGRRAGADAVGTAERLQGTFAPARVGLVHGRMNQDERDRVMQDFRDGALDILVATTVIEVGVDVPEATVMVVLDAHLFGLAQLHQLRGRVGRGGGASYCLLMTRGTLTGDAERRLAVMAATTDGFVIAEEDLAIRGPGELLGVRQAGLPTLRFGDLRQHAELLADARAAADRLLDQDPELTRPEHAATRRALRARTRGLAIYGEESG